MEFKIVLHRKTIGKGIIAFDAPQNGAESNTLRELLRLCRDKYSDYVSLTFKPPYKPRTTGAQSQNHHLNGHIMQICRETGNDYETIKYCVKMKAVELFGYPYKQIGKYIMPQSESDCSTEECAMLIEAVHILASELSIVLQE
jgi:hypothetical protein